MRPPPNGGSGARADRSRGGVRAPLRRRPVRPRRRARGHGAVVGRGPGRLRGGPRAVVGAGRPACGDGRELARLGPDHARAPRPPDGRGGDPGRRRGRRAGLLSRPRTAARPGRARGAPADRRDPARGHRLLVAPGGDRGCRGCARVARRPGHRRLIGRGRAREAGPRRLSPGGAPPRRGALEVPGWSRTRLPGYAPDAGPG